MTDEQGMVEAFHRNFDIVVSPVPTIADGRTRELRVRLIQEEFDELKEALASDDLPSIAKEMADHVSTNNAGCTDDEGVFATTHTAPSLFPDAVSLRRSPKSMS